MRRSVRRPLDGCCRCWFALGYFGLVFLALPGRAHELAVEVVVTPPIAIETVVRLTPTGNDLDEPISRTLRAPGRLALELPEGDGSPTAWQVELTAPGFWAPTERIVPTDGETVRIRMYRTGTITGSVVPPAGDELPGEITVRWAASPVGDEQAIPEAALHCPLIVEERPTASFHCDLPVGLLDLQLRARGFISHRFLDVQIRSEETRPLGVLPLRRGASLVGSVVASTGELDRDDARVLLAPVTSAPALGEAAVERRRRLELTARLDERGSFAFDDILPGLYQVTVEHPEFAPARLGPVQVLANAETQLRKPLMLEPPLDLDVFLTPPQDPAGESWRIDLYEEGPDPHMLSEVAVLHASSAGSATLTHLAPGSYLVEVWSSDGSRVAWERVEIDRTSPPLEIELVLIQVTGEVYLGDDPLVADLHFGGRTGTERIRLESTDDGAYSGILPRPGRWRVHIDADEPPVRRDLEVEVEPDADGVAQLDLRLPATVLRGRVLDPQGEPVDRAIVSLGDVDQAFFSHTGVDEDGEYSFHGVDAGLLYLSAEAPDSLTAEKLITLVEDREHEEDLQLSKSRVLTGTVEAAEGPLPAARVLALIRGGPEARLGRSPSGATDAAGTFEIQVPASAQGVDLLVQSPGHPMGVYSFAQLPREPLFLRIGDTAGTVELEVGAALEWADQDQKKPALLYRGVLLSPHLLLRWAEMHGFSQEDADRLVVPQLPPGDYAACLLNLNDFVESTGPFTGCVSGLLTPMGVLQLTLDGP